MQSAPVETILIAAAAYLLGSVSFAILVSRLMGLPDLSEVHEVYLEKLKTVADKGLTPDMVQNMIRNWVPMGDQSMDFIKGLMGGLAGGGLAGKDKK